MSMDLTDDGKKALEEKDELLEGGMQSAELSVGGGYEINSKQIDVAYRSGDVEKAYGALLEAVPLDSLESSREVEEMLSNMDPIDRTKLVTLNDEAAGIGRLDQPLTSRGTSPLDSDKRRNLKNLSEGLDIQGMVDVSKKISEDPAYVGKMTDVNRRRLELRMDRVQRSDAYVALQDRSEDPLDASAKLRLNAVNDVMKNVGAGV